MSRHDDIPAGGHQARALSDAEAMLDAALNGMQQGLCMFDAEGRIVMFNQRYIDLMKLPATTWSACRCSSCSAGARQAAATSAIRIRCLPT